MAYQNPAFYFYHGAREALSIAGFAPHSQVFDAIHDGRQGEPYFFATDFAAADFKVFEIERSDTPAADAIDTIIISGHNWTGANLGVTVSPTPVDLLIPVRAVTEAAGVPIFVTLTSTQVVAGGHEFMRLDVLDGTAPGTTVPEATEIFFTTKREMSRGPDPNWEHPWLRQQTQFTNEAGVTSTWLKGAARKLFSMTWRGLEGADRQLLFDLQAQTNDWSEPFWFQPPDDTYETLLVELERDADWTQDFLSPLDTGTTDEVTLELIEVLG